MLSDDRPGIVSPVGHMDVLLVHTCCGLRRIRGVSAGTVQVTTLECVQRLLPAVTDRTEKAVLLRFKRLIYILRHTPATRLWIVHSETT